MFLYFFICIYCKLTRSSYSCFWVSFSTTPFILASALLICNHSTVRTLGCTIHHPVIHLFNPSISFSFLYSLYLSCIQERSIWVCMALCVYLAGCVCVCESECTYACQGLYVCSPPELNVPSNLLQHLFWGGDTFINSWNSRFFWLGTQGLMMTAVLEKVEGDSLSNLFLVHKAPYWGALSPTCSNNKTLVRDWAGSAPDPLAALRNTIREIWGSGLSLSQGRQCCYIFLLLTKCVLNDSLPQTFENRDGLNSFIHLLLACYVPQTGWELEK